MARPAPPTIAVASEAAEDTWSAVGVRLVPYRPSVAEALREAWSFRSMLVPLGQSVVRRQVRLTALGLWWIPIIVLFATVGRTLIFGRLLNVPSIPGIPYFLYVLTGTFAWTVFDRSLIFTLKSFQLYSRLTRDLWFPLLLVPVAANAQGLYLWATHGAVVLGALGAYSIADHRLFVPVGPKLLLLPLGALWCLVLGCAFGVFTAPVYTRARDIRNVLRLIMPFWMYASPIVYPLDAVGSRAALIAQINPVATPIELFKEGAFDGGHITVLGLVISMVSTLVAVVGGAVYLTRSSPRLVGVGQYDDDDDDDQDDDV